MGTRIRNEISKRKEYWIPKHRHLELVHFCLQYPEWKERLSCLDGYSDKTNSIVTIPEDNGYTGNPVELIVSERLYLEDRIHIIEFSAKESGSDLYKYLLKGVTENIGYEALGIPCCKDVYYRMYRKFFCLLDKARK